MKKMKNRSTNWDNDLLGTNWGTGKLDDRASAGMTEGMKQSLRDATARLSAIEGRKVSMSEIIRRLLAAGGLR